MKKLFNKKNILYTFFIFSIILFLIFGLLKINNYTFFIASVSLNILFLIILKIIVNKFKIKFTKKEILIIILSIGVLYLFYIIAILTRKFIYYWDYSCYYNIQIKTINYFNKGIIIGIKSFINSTWEGEYGSFLNFIPHVIFNFTNKSINSYLVSCVLIFIPYLIITYSILAKRIIDIIKIKNNKTLMFFLLMISFILMPILHGTFIYGQPDLFGMVFIFIIITLTIDYNFKKLETDRLILILLVTFMLTICRRWYIYWIISYYFLYIISILISNKKDYKKILKNIIIYGIIVIVIYFITLLPFIKNTILNNYSSSYSFYSNGGIIYELANQERHLGYLILMIIFGGILYGIINKEYRKITIFNIIQFLMIIIMFTRIQTMGIHHSLLLLPSYLLCISLFIICIFNNKKIIFNVTILTFIVLLITNFFWGYQNKYSKLFTDIKLKTPEEKNYNEIKKITDWLGNQLDKNNTAYMITHNNELNPDKFRNFYTPNSKVSKYLPYGSAIIGVHKFPTELFSAKYIITTDPYIPTSVDEKYNKVCNELVKEERFRLKKEFIMNDKTKLIVYERIKKVDENEKNKYINALEEESKKYVNLYDKVILEYNQ